LPIDLKDLDPFRSMVKIFAKAISMIFLGVVIVLVFSNPLVIVLNMFATVTTIPPFYVSFVVTPIFTNLPLIVSSIKYAGLKTKNSVSISLFNLQRCAIINMTFSMGIF